MARHSLFFAPGEWYHCYSRGIDKRKVFESKSDYHRFVELLYVTNTSDAKQRSDLTYYSHDEIFAIPRKNTLTSIGAYCLMPNHFHLLLHETEDGGISTFMQKLGTAYAMYFNIKYERSGGLFTRPFRSSHIAKDRYFQHVVDYIHLNPLGMLGKDRIFSYPYSSLKDFISQDRAERTLLGKEVFDVYQKKSLRLMIKNAAELVKATP